MTTDPHAGPGEPEQPPARDLRADLADAIGAATGPRQAAEAVLGVLRDFARPDYRSTPPVLADLLAALAAGLAGHPGRRSVRHPGAHRGRG